MGQRDASAVQVRRPVESPDSVQFCAFSTASGWMGLAGQQGRVCGLMLGHRDRRSVMDQAAERYGNRLKTTDWNPELVSRLQAYMQGIADDFADVELDLPPATAFQHAVREVVRAIPYGETASYAEVARRAGSPRAARGVGGVMSSNPIPILIPCHRVVGSGGGPGGFSAPRGIELKRWLLEREAEGVAAVAD